METKTKNDLSAMTIPDLNREKREILKLVRAASRREPFDQQAYDDHMAEVDRIGEAIDEATEERDYIESRRVPGGVLDGGDGGDYAATARAVTGVEAARCANLFGDARKFGPMNSSNGFESLDDFLTSLASGRNDQRLYEARAQSGGVPSEGGFSVPDQFVNEWLDATLEQEIVRPRARIIGMTSSTVRVPAWVNDDHQDGNRFGGLQAQWVGEDGTMSITSAKMRQIQLTAKKLYLLTKASRELVSDGMSFAEQLQGIMRQESNFVLDDGFLNGDGSSGPLGMLNSGNPALIVQAKESGQAANTIVVENLDKMESRLPGRSQEQAIWVIHSSTIPALRRLTISVGTGGSQITQALEGKVGNRTLLGRKAIVTEKASQLGSQGDVSLIDPSEYVVGLRSEIEIAVSEHVSFTTDEINYRSTIRADGMPTWNSALTQKDGVAANTQSPYITLAVRA